MAYLAVASQIIDDGKVDRRYYNACVERHNFYPVALEDIKAFFKGHDRTQARSTLPLGSHGTQLFTVCLKPLIITWPFIFAIVISGT
jgi:hypothetical protein